MKFIDEYRDPQAAHALAAELARIITRPWTLMEVCGGQTHAILRFGIDRLLPPQLRLIHGPGCPVCVTPAGMIDQAVELAARHALGMLPASGLGLRDEFAEFDAARRFHLGAPATSDDSECRGGEIMLGTLRPDQCPAFGTRCTPERPLGAPMVSSEGACAAYFRFRHQPSN